MKRIILSMLAVSALVFTSCSDDEDENKPEPKPTVTAPATYEFKRNDKSTVSFSGQTTRIKMAKELVDAMKDNSKTKEQLIAMFAHVEGGNDFSDADLNASGKNVRSKTATSADFFASNTTDANAIKEQFDAWITEQADNVFPKWNETAVAGSAGGIQQNGGGSTRYVNGKGVELNQIFAKGLIGALMADQILNNYLSVAVLDAGDNKADNTAKKVSAGKPYTTMEHKWDEAYGYLYGAETNAALPSLDAADSFLNKYLKKVAGDDDFKAVKDDIFNAFKLGRAAIVANDYELRDKQADIIREKISMVIAVRAVYYLQQGKAKWATDKASAFHDISEGLGFIYSLQFTRKPGSNDSYFTKTEVEGYLSDLLDMGDGLWESTTPNTLQTISEKIAGKFDFTVEQAAN